MKQALSLSILVILTITFAGCGKKNTLTGTKYVSEKGNETCDFRSSTKVYIADGSSTFECEYTVDGNEVSVDTHTIAGKMVLTLHPNDTLTGFRNGATFKKVQ